MVDVKQDKSRPSSSIDLQVIEISSDSEDDVFCQPHTRFVSAIQGENKPHESSSAWENDVIELTDSESDDSDLPDMLSPLVKRPGRKGFANPPSENFMPLYADTSDDGGSDEDCILVLNDPPDSRRPIRSISRTQDRDIAKSHPSLDSPKKNVVPECSRAARDFPNKRIGRSAHKAKEQAVRQKYAAELFAELNEDVFGDRLPKNTTLEWSKRLLTTAGRARWHRSHDGVHTTKIELASKILDCDERIRNTLSHEMCHLACWVIDNQPREGHGQLFKSWANKVMHKRPDIHISTRHNYEISYPYEWKCEKCSKIYGRYSKSIRPEECVCGACKIGKLIPLFIEGRKTTSKVSRLAINKPQDSPRSIVGNPANNPVVGQISVPLPSLSGKDILNLVDTLKGISINHTSDS